MASVDLDGFPVADMPIVPFVFGGLLGAAVGGPGTMISRLGDRWAAEVVGSNMRIEPDGRRWYPKLVQGKRLGVILPMIQPDFEIGAPGEPTVSADTTEGRIIPVTGGTPNYVVRAGQFLNYYDTGGQAYLDQATEQVILDEDGAGTITIQNLLRVALSEDDPINLADPVIEGWLIGEIPMPRPVEKITSFSFRVEEKS